jgi:hypothetical protein
MLKNAVQPGRPKMTMWHMLIVCWLSKATNTHSGYATVLAFSLQHWLHEHVSMLYYTHIVYLVVP